MCDVWQSYQDLTLQATCYQQQNYANDGKRAGSWQNWVFCKAYGPSCLISVSFPSSGPLDRSQVYSSSLTTAVAAAPFSACKMSFLPNGSACDVIPWCNGKRSINTCTLILKLIISTTILLDKLSKHAHAGTLQWVSVKQQEKQQKLMVKIITCRDGPVRSTETRQGRKHKTTLIWKNDGKWRLKDYSTSVAWHSYMQQI